MIGRRLRAVFLRDGLVWRGGAPVDIVTGLSDAAKTRFVCVVLVVALIATLCGARSSPWSVGLREGRSPKRLACVGCPLGGSC